MGSAYDTFPYVLPKVYNQHREIYRQIMERRRAARQQEEEQQQEEEEQATQGNSKTEFTLLLMRTLEDMTPDEAWETELRNSLQTQLIEFLNQSTSEDPDYLVKEYDRYLAQVISAQTSRLRLKWGTDMKAMLKDSGRMRRVVAKIPDAARETFKNNTYNPDKHLGIQDVNDEAEYEVDEADQSSSAK